MQAVVGVIGVDGAMSARDLDKKRKKKKKKRKLWRDEKVLEAMAGFRDLLDGAKSELIHAYI